MADEFQFDVFLSHSPSSEVSVRLPLMRLQINNLRTRLDRWGITPNGNSTLSYNCGLETNAVRHHFLTEGNDAYEHVFRNDAVHEGSPSCL